MRNNLEISSATGVDVQLNIAGPGARSYAFVIDWHIRLLLALAWFAGVSAVVFGSLNFADNESANYNSYMFLVIIPSFAIYFLYHPVLEIAMRGRTPGKRIAGVRIVTEDAQMPGLMAHLIRNVLRILDSMPVGYVIGLVSTLLTEKSVRIGDIAAGTVLVYDLDDRDIRTVKPDINPAAISRYGLAKAELGQELLDRWDELDSRERIRLTEKLLAQLDPEVQQSADEFRLRQQLVNLLNVDPVAE
jgi:uncharacterized RDD family membrane protein YckC